MSTYRVIDVVGWFKSRNIGMSVRNIRYYQSVGAIRSHKVSGCKEVFYYLKDIKRLRRYLEIKNTFYIDDKDAIALLCCKISEINNLGCYYRRF